MKGKEKSLWMKRITGAGRSIGHQALMTIKMCIRDRDAIKRGAEEVDMVINVGALLAGDTDTVYNDIKGVVEAAGGTLVKVIIETCSLSDDQKLSLIHI